MYKEFFSYLLTLIFNIVEHIKLFGIKKFYLANILRISFNKDILLIIYGDDHEK